MTERELLPSLQPEGDCFASIAEKSLQTKCKPGLLAYCPTMDLIALVDESDHVHVFRFNGQRVFGGGYGAEGLQVTGIRWKPNGEIR